MEGLALTLQAAWAQVAGAVCLQPLQLGVVEVVQCSLSSKGFQHSSNHGGDSPPAPGVCDVGLAWDQTCCPSARAGASPAPGMAELGPLRQTAPFQKAHDLSFCIINTTWGVVSITIGF